MLADKIDFVFEDVYSIKFNQNYIKNRVNHLIKNELKKLGDLSIILCSDSYLLQINKKYLNHDYYTDIITFNYVEDTRISGDLFISLERIKENAIVYKKDFLNELVRVIFHGILHLTGYNDKTEEEKKLMRSKEDYYLDKVDFSELEK